jgi:catechol 2,3-dioxygenase-like lactoylglutathione lyase family enzyme
MTDTSPAWLAKDCLDVGVFTNRLDEMRAFWQQDVGLPFDHMLPLGGGLRQHRYDHQGSVFKLNHSRDPLAPGTHGGYLRLIIARDSITAPTELTDPDGNRVALVRPGHDGITQWAIEVATPSRQAFLAFYHDALGLPVADTHPCAVACGRSLILGHIDPALAARTESADMARIGYRYTTLQVDKVDRVHAQVLAAGGTEGRAPATLGKTARISFVRDGCGNWMELSQRASITGSLEP